jgi:hypothetical protein
METPAGTPRTSMLPAAVPGTRYGMERDTLVVRPPETVTVLVGPGTALSNGEAR